MADLLGFVTQLFSGAMSWVGTLVNFVSTNVFTVLFVVAVPLVGLAVGLLRRILRIN